MRSHVWPLLLCAAWTVTGEFSDALAYYHYAFAGAAYCPADSLATWSCVPCRRANASSVSSLKVYENATTDARAFTAVTLRDDSAEIVLSWRGTETLENWVENLKISRTDRGLSCDGCAVHSGFAEVWRSLSNRILPELVTLRAAHPSAPLVIVGHSLGGAVATISAYELAVDHGIPVHAVFTYGSPRVGNAAFARQRFTAAGQWRVTHHRDIVPHVPPEHILGFHHTSTEAFYDDDSRRYTLCDGSGEDLSCSAQYMMPLSIDDHLHYYGELIGQDGCGGKQARVWRRGGGESAAGPLAPRLDTAQRNDSNSAAASA